MANKAFVLIALFFIVLCISASNDNKNDNKNEQKFHIVKKRIQQPFPYTLQYFLVNNKGKEVSPWSDVNINLDKDTLTGIIEIPKEVVAKYEVQKKIKFHPLMQDTRPSAFIPGQKQLRQYARFLPLINYGSIPQTWSQTIRQENGNIGDDDAVDIIDLSSKERKILDIVSLKVLGSFALIDNGNEMDWKIFVIDPKEAKQKKINSIADIPTARVEEIVNWFKVYKTWDGKPLNVVGQVKSKEDTLEIIRQSNIEFKNLVKGEGQYAAKKLEFNL